MPAPARTGLPAYRGTSAAPGRASGPAFRARTPEPATTAPLKGDPQAALKAALALAVAELRALAGSVDGQGSDVLDFQIEMLLDEELLAPALARIAEGEGAALAWAGAMTAYIDAFAKGEADDGAFAARAADLADLRQRVLDALAGRKASDFPAGSIYVGHDMPPGLFLGHDWSRGGAIALTAGSTVSHVALLARTRGVPMVVGLGEIPIADGQTLLVDGNEGRVSVPADSASAPVTPASDGPARTQADGSDRIAGVRLCANLNSLSDLDGLDAAAVDGVGLVRTEFLFLSPAEMLNEERHVECYRRIVARLGGRPVTLRMLDLGGDKAVPGLVEGGTASPLGERGVRLLLAHPELARTQARALMRVAMHGPVSILLPMVTIPDEFAAIERLFAEEEMHLARLGVPARRPPLGIMVEVPAAALTLDLFDRAAFFSVGTNDLMQYLSAAARDNPTVAHLHMHAETALFRLLDHVCAAARSLGKPVSVCGDLAGQPHGLTRLMDAGFRDFSVSPGRLPAVQALLRNAATAPVES